MTTKKIPLKEASDAQLKNFAESNLGIDLPKKPTRDLILARIADADSSGQCVIEEVDPELAVQATGPVPRNFAHIEGAATRLVAKGAAAKEDPPVLLIITKTDQEGGDEPVPVSVNGSAMYIPRGKLVQIPYRFYEALSHAVKRVYRQDDEGLGKIEGRDVPAYPLDVKYVPPADEISAWALRTSGNPLPVDAAA